ncbi:MAG: hypothetical protein JWR77_1868 [Rhizorhabdus sp.]|nr:hypothetical protein [Rhizorhabdus sp.]
MKRTYLLALLAVLPAVASAAPFTVASTGKPYPTLLAAVQAIGDGDGTILIAPGTYRECAVQEAGRITYRATRPGTAIFEGSTCESKAALVLRGRGAVVDGLVFQNMRVPDGNGAGIRIERGPLAVTRSIFRNSEEGILGHDDPNADVRVERSTFSGLGRCDRDLPCAHSIYIGNYRSVTVLRSRFERGQGGHYVKSRAATIGVSDCSFDDIHGHASNYMIDLPSGATGIIRRNIFVQGPDKENHSAIVAVAAEARMHPSAGLTVIANKAHQAAGITWPTALVADWSRSPMTIERNIVGARITLYQAADSAESPSLIGKARYYLSKIKERLLG